MKEINTKEDFLLSESFWTLKEYKKLKKEKRPKRRKKKANLKFKIK